MALTILYSSLFRPNLNAMPSTMRSLSWAIEPITPTLSKEKLKGLNVITKESEWGKGIYLLGNTLKTGVIVVHQLPKTPDTVWFRVLGRGKIQQEAIDEIAALPADSPYRNGVLALFSTLKVMLESRTNREADETELLMKLTRSPLFIEYMGLAGSCTIELSLGQDSYPL
jgi:hypothetical protein